MQRKFIIETDGGSRGNPGPAAIGIVIRYEKGKRKEYSEYIGRATNNEAEYIAAITALERIKRVWSKKTAKESIVKLSTDSEFLVKQMNGRYKVEEPKIQRLFIQLWNLKVDFNQVDFEHVPREKNSEADRLVNTALDRSEKSNNKI